MNVDHLKLFSRVAETQNISVAGREMGLSPAVASSYISKLETCLGTRLVHRTTRKVALTEEGQAFLSHARDVLDSVEAAYSSVGKGTQSPSGILRVTAPASFGRLHLMPGLKGFMEKYPDLTVDFRFSDAIVDMVEGGFDIAIRNAALEDSSLIARKLAPDSRIVCASPGYLARFGVPATPAELKQHDCIHLSGSDSWTFKSGKDLISVKTHAKFRTDNGDALRHACIDGLGIGINSVWSIHSQLARGELVQILRDYPLVSDTALWALYPSNRQLASKVRAFIDYYVEYFASKDCWHRFAD